MQQTSYRTTIRTLQGGENLLDQLIQEAIATITTKTYEELKADPELTKRFEVHRPVPLIEPINHCRLYFDTKLLFELYIDYNFPMQENNALITTFYQDSEDITCH